MLKRIGILILLCLSTQVVLLRAQNLDDNTTLQHSFPDIVDQIKRGVAYVEVGTNVEGFSSQGTAFLIHKAGILATCSHTLFDTSISQGKFLIPDTSRIYVKFHNHTIFYRANFLTHRQDRDIAIIRVQAEQRELDSLNLLPITFGSVEDIREGVEIACTGYDLSQKTKGFGRTYFWLTTHHGIVSCVGSVGPTISEEFVDFFQADMLLNRGASGSPVYLVKDGRVIGMNKGFMGQEKEGILVNYGVANCVPAWAIFKLFDAWLRSIQASDTTKTNRR